MKILVVMRLFIKTSWESRSCVILCVVATVEGTQVPPYVVMVLLSSGGPYWYETPLVTML